MKKPLYRVDSKNCQVEIGENHLTITIPHLVPGKKNSKFIARRKDKSATLITKPEYQERISATMEDLLAELRLAIRTSGDGTTGTLQRQSMICSLLPEDDCWTKLPKTSQTGVLSKGAPYIKIYLAKTKDNVV